MLSSCIAYLVQVLGLNLVPGITHTTRFVGLRKYQLVDNNIVSVYFTLGQLLDQPLSLIQRQELRNTDTNEGGLLLWTRQQNISKGSTTSSIINHRGQ